MKAEYSNLAVIAAKEKNSFEQYLSMLTNVELERRQELKVKRLLSVAKLPVDKSLDDYNFTEINGIGPRDLLTLSTGGFVEQSENVVLYGDIGVGKTHLAIGIVKKLCDVGIRSYFTSVSALIELLLEAKKNLNLANLWKRLDRFQLIVCDELGYLPQTKDGADLFFQFISQRYERRSILITTNLAYSKWDEVFLDKITTTAAVDRIIHHCKTFNIQGPSWRRSHAEKTKHCN
jgi:DNA replication protein DnaC